MDAVRLLGRLTPSNAQGERVRLAEALKRGDPALPQWTWDRDRDRGEGNATAHAAGGARWHLPAAKDFDALADLADTLGTLGQLYGERARELGLEARLAGCIGTAKFGDLAKLRFAPRPKWAARARTLARGWLSGAIEIAGDEEIGPSRSDDERDPTSLVSRMREAVSNRAELAAVYRVSVNPRLASLAATGEREIHVAEGRMMLPGDVARTVLHEIEAHAIPRARARHHGEAIFSLGTANGTDDQEGRALLLESRAGHLSTSRRHALARRHLSCLAMNDGADFAEVTRHLVSDLGAREEDAVLIGERVFRGSDGSKPGLGRERIYLEAYLEMEAAFGRDPSLEVVIAAGQVSLRAAPLLRDLV